MGSNGVTGDQQIHVLLTQGSRLLEVLFPGLSQELADVDAPEVNWTADSLWLGPEGWMPRSDSELNTRACSRVYLEWHLRQRLHQNPHIHWQERTTVQRLLADETRSQITGVQLHHLDTQQESMLVTDLVVDASGRNSHLPQWLTDLDYAWPTTIGAQPSRLVRMMHRYLDLLFVAVTDSPRIQRTVLEVFHMFKPPAALFQPFIVWRVVKLLLGMQPGRSADQPPLDTRTDRLVQPVDEPPIRFGEQAAMSTTYPK